MFARGDVSSARVIMEGLDKFKNMSGLVPSMAKSTVFFGNVKREDKQSILQLMPFEEGSLPFRRLGVPLISSRLVYKDCKILIERLVSRKDSWKNKTLSFAGRLQLIKSVLSSMHIFWAFVFTLPARITADLEKKMRAFLWCQGPMKQGRAKVKWSDVCRQKFEGGLGIRRIRDMNMGLMTNHVWSLLTRRNSIWVEWIHVHKVKDQSFWQIPARGNSSTGWRNIMNLHDRIRPFIVSKIGDGSSTYA
ncbi:putative RNA-directed DNA polymerase [Helianthus debilis subsp. tardiflorus]